ncbi:Optic atrophy 3 protein [Homalodisca vitripennis]|nr:Optic atrophy 3 protein [Homalodisca vitripennis]
MKLWVLNLGKPVKVPKLNEAMAIELGASLLGEFIIFLIAAGLLLAEYTRQTRKETAKEIARQEEIYKIQLTVKELNFQTERQDTQIRELLETISDLEKRVSKVPWNRNKPELPETRTLDESDSLQDIKYYHQKGFAGMHRRIWGKELIRELPLCAVLKFNNPLRSKVVLLLFVLGARMASSTGRRHFVGSADFNILCDIITVL